MKRKAIILILDISESIGDIENYLRGISKESFLEDKKTQDAIVRRLEIIGEATKGLPLDFRKKYNDIPWKDIAGTRDKLIHDYFGVNVNRVWKVASENIPDLKAKILKILEEMGESSKNQKLI